MQPTQIQIRKGTARYKLPREEEELQLQEQVAEAICDSKWVCSDVKWAHLQSNDRNRQPYLKHAKAVLPIIEAQNRKERKQIYSDLSEIVSKCNDCKLLDNNLTEYWVKIGLMR